MTPGPIDVQAIRRHFTFPEHGRIVDEQRGEHPAAAGAARAVPVARARVRERAPRAVHRLAADDRAVRGVLRHDRAVHRRAGPGQHRAVPEHDRGHQRGHVLAAHRVPRRRQRRHDDDGAQLQLRPLVRDVPGDTAAARAAGGIPAGPVRSGHRRAGPRSPGVADRRPHQAGLLHRRVELPRHPQPAGRRPGAGRRQRIPAAGRRAAVVPAGRRRPAGAGVVRRRAGPRRRLPGVLLPQDAGAVRGRRAVRQGAPAAGPRCRSCTAAT